MRGGAGAFSTGAAGLRPRAAFGGGAAAGVVAGAAARPAALLRGRAVAFAGAAAFRASLTSAAIISSLGLPDTTATPGTASSTPRLKGSSAVTTSVRSSSFFSTSRALRGGGSAMLASGT